MSNVIGFFLGFLSLMIGLWSVYIVIHLENKTKIFQFDVLRKKLCDLEQMIKWIDSTITESSHIITKDGVKKLNLGSLEFAFMLIDKLIKDINGLIFDSKLTTFNDDFSMFYFNLIPQFPKPNVKKEYNLEKYRESLFIYVETLENNLTKAGVLNYKICLKILGTKENRKYKYTRTWYRLINGVKILDY